MTSSQKPPRRPKPQAVAQLQACLVVAFQALYRAQVAGAYNTGVFGSLQHVVVKGSLRHAGRVDT